MSFAIFVTWILVGVLAGLLGGLVLKRGGYGLKPDVMLALAGSIGLSWLLRGTGIFTGTGIAGVAIVAFIGASLAIVVQRKFRATDHIGDGKVGLWRWGLGAAVVAVTAWMVFAPAHQPAATAATVEDKAYTVTSSTMKVKAGIVTGEMTDMKVMERIEQGSGRIVAPAKFSARVTLKNASTSQSVRLVGGKIHYIDAQGKRMELEGNRSEPAFKFAATGSDRLDPGQEITESLDVEFPADALAATTLKEIRLELAYVPSPYREETSRFPVSIGGK
jgi:uncharacterized membrane protein YeaQ/YmgE (transglycosylase-associated protein family)